MIIIIIFKVRHILQCDVLTVFTVKRKCHMADRQAGNFLLKVLYSHLSILEFLTKKSSHMVVYTGVHCQGQPAAKSWLGQLSC